MTIANLPSIVGTLLIVGGMFLVLVQFFFRPSSNDQIVYGSFVTMIIVGAVYLGVGSFVHC